MRVGSGIVFALLAGILAAPRARASIMVEGYYRMGDDDPGAAPMAIANDPTKDSSGKGRDLTRFVANDNTLESTPHYHNDILPPISKYTNRLAAYFAGGDSTLNDFIIVDRFNRNTSLPMGNKWGMEAWICGTAIAMQNSYFLFNGSAPTSGAGFRVANGTLSGRINGTQVGSFPYTVGQWLYVAMVQDGSKATLYTQRVGDSSLLNMGSINTATPVNPTSGFQIGAKWSDRGGYGFTGYIDEVRVFTFTGSFDTNDLLINSAPAPLPEPGSLALLGIGAIGLLGRRRPRR